MQLSLHQLAFALIAVMWWVATWGLTDLMIEGWSRQRKFVFFISLLGLILILLQFFPEILPKF